MDRPTRIATVSSALLLLVAAPTSGACLVLQDDGIIRTPAEGARPGRSSVPDTVAPDTLPTYVLDSLVVEGRSDDMTGIAVTASQGVVGHRDIRTRPLTREGELLETVPGLIMTQHSGDGKANQMFVRGFNLDHGTDFSTKVEGMPVNIPTHAHGQGYTDLNFVVPELVDAVEYRLGPYYADIGDFGSAGGAHLRLRSSLDRPLARVGLGEDGFRRIVGAGSVDPGPGRLLAGGELKGYDGPWAVPQELEKKAGMARYSWEDGRNAFSLLGLGYDNAWNGSDQIPRRLVERGEIGRFAQVDSTLGGATSRYSLSASWRREGPETSHRLRLYGIRYHLDVWSNFTYYLNDPDNGDQLGQEDEGRTVLGGSYAHARPLGDHVLTVGGETRLDLLDVALRETEKRQPLSTVRRDEVAQWATGAYVEVESEWSSRIRSVLGIRSDLHRFDVASRLAANSGTVTDGIASPKASLILTPGEGADEPGQTTEIYLSGGLGFHSNDARGTVQAIDPSNGQAVDPVDPLVRSRGAEVGVRATLAPGWRSTLTGWTVELDSELLFEGDAGTTGPSDASRRLGVTWANFWRMTPKLRTDLDVSVARARFHRAPEAENRIPGAMESVVTAGLVWESLEDGPFATLRLRHFGEYPLVEDGSVRASATSLMNLSAGWSLGGLRIGASVLNLLDVEDADIEYFHRSRVPGEPAEGVEDVHFHPVEPRQLRFTAHWRP